MLTFSSSAMTRSRKDENGNVIFYILICVVLLAALTMYMSSTGGDTQASGGSAFRMSEEIKSQAQGARSAITECFLVYTAPYPTGSGNTPLLNIPLSTVECETSTGVFQNVFTSQSARSIPVPPNPFEAWTYSNTTGTGTFVKISMVAPANKAASTTVRMTLKNLAQAFHAAETGVGSNIYQNQDVCIIDTGTEAEFHACLKSSTGVCGKVAPNNVSPAQHPCDP